MEKAKTDKKKLIEVAKELNGKILTKDSAIPTGRKATAVQLEKDIREAASLIQADDKFSEMTEKALAELGIQPFGGKTEKAKPEPAANKAGKAADKPIGKKDKSAIQISAEFITAGREFTKAELVENILSFEACGPAYSKLIADVSIKLLSSMLLLDARDNKKYIFKM